MTGQEKSLRVKGAATMALGKSSQNRKLATIDYVGRATRRHSITHRLGASHTAACNLSYSKVNMLYRLQARSRHQMTHAIRLSLPGFQLLNNSLYHGLI